MNENSWQFLNPHFLWLLILVPIYLYFKYRNARKSTNALSLPSASPFGNTSSFLNVFAYILPLLRAAFIGLLIVALARPQIPIAETDVNNEKGVDILMCVDVSFSMLAQDFEPNRIGALKDIAKKYIDKTTSDRIGIVAYAPEAILKIPLTTDKQMLKKTIDQLSTKELNTQDNSGTNIGIGLLTAINHIKDSKAKSKVIILLSDGENNRGSDSETIIASHIAAEKGIKIYTIGIGKKASVKLPIGNYQVHDTTLNEELLQNVAANTDGKYFHATSKDMLEEIYDEINQLEKSDLGEVPKYAGFKELYHSYLVWALIILMIELLLRTFIYKSA